jgi:hypothetical protein
MMPILRYRSSGVVRAITKLRNQYFGGASRRTDYTHSQTAPNLVRDLLS